MKSLVSLPLSGLQQYRKRSLEVLLFRVLPHYLMDKLHRYFELEVIGAENIPRQGPVIISPNHSGFAGFDAMLLTHEIFRFAHRVPRVLTHHLWFLTRATSIPANKMGYVEATTNNGIRELNRNHLVIIFPEGEQGNFKPSAKAYELQEFKRGFIRMALATGAPIVPTLIIGAEETHINLRQIKLKTFFKDVLLPLPLNIIPLPAKWTMIFLKPIQIECDKSRLQDREYISQKASEIQKLMQAALDEELIKRKGRFAVASDWFKEILQSTKGSK